MTTSRRNFLGMLGGGLLSFPLVHTFSRSAHATGAKAKRLILFYSPNGTVHEHYWPVGSRHQFSFASNSILSPLEDHIDDLIILKGLEFYEATGHTNGIRAMWTNNAGNPSMENNISIDQFVAQHIGQDTQFPSLNLGVQTTHGASTADARMCFSGPDQLVVPDDNPINTYRNMFADQLIDAAVVEKRRTRRQKILQFSEAQISLLQDRLGGHEKEKIDIHLDSIARLEHSLFHTSECAPTTEPEVGLLGSDQSFPAILDAQMELAVKALECGMTRVASIQCSNNISPTVFSWLGYGDQHHSLAHQYGSAFVACERWYSAQFARLLQLLNREDPEYGGRMIDHTLVVWGKDLGHSSNHDCQDVPFVLAGGGLSGGQYINLGHRYHGALLVSIAQAFGIDIETFGNPNSGTGGLEELS